MIKIKPIIRKEETPDQLVNVIDGVEVMDGEEGTLIDNVAVVVRAYSTLAAAKAHDGVIADEDYDTSVFVAKKKADAIIATTEAVKQEALDYLAETDYVVIKIAEGAATKAAYLDVIKRRGMARNTLS